MTAEQVKAEIDLAKRDATAYGNGDLRAEFAYLSGRLERMYEWAATECRRLEHQIEEDRRLESEEIEGACDHAGKAEQCSI